MFEFVFTTFRSRTRGKSPKEFSYRGVGKAISRKVIDKDNNPVVVDASGNPVDYKYEKVDGKYQVSGNEGISLDDKGNLVLSNGLRFVEVDDADIEALIPKTAEGKDDEEKAKELISPIIGQLYNRSVANAIRGLLIHYNEKMRDEEAAKYRAPEKEDELQEIVNLLRAEKLITSDEAETKWRRQVSMGYEADGGKEGSGRSKLEFAYSTFLGRKVKDKRPAVAA